MHLDLQLIRLLLVDASLEMVAMKMWLSGNRKHVFLTQEAENECKQA